jgi:hypothetical protein
MAAVDLSPIDEKRQAFATARVARLAAQADLVARNAAVISLARTLPPDAPQLQAAKEALGVQREKVAATWLAEKSAIDELNTALANWLTRDPDVDILRFDARFPIVLVPLRLETRFVAEHSELRVRVYPDEISADMHEPELSAAERQAGDDYWARALAGQESLTAWQVLLQTYPAPRAAWIVRETAPGAHAATQGFQKSAGWSRAVEARLMPDRFVVVATRGPTTRRSVGAPVVEPLTLSVGPDTPDSDRAAVGPDGKLKVDEAVKWTIDWEAAVAAGMGISLPVDGTDLRLGFDRLVVVGVKTSLDAAATARGLGALFDAHHYTSGLAFVKQGTPTSNTIGKSAGYPPPDPNGARSFAVERGPALDQREMCAADLLTSTLGMPRGLFAHVDGADLSEAVPAQRMNRVLFQATLGYFLDQLMSPLIDPGSVNEVGKHFSQWVIPRGMAQAFRVGRVPYGILPATSLRLWQTAPGATAVQTRMVALLQHIHQLWLSATPQAPHVGRGADPDQDLLDVLSMDASARQMRVRRAVGNGTWLNMVQLFNWPMAQWDSEHKRIGALALSFIGVDPNLHPRTLDLNLADHSYLYHVPDVDIVPSSEAAPLSHDYITWMRRASIEQLHLEQLPADWPDSVKRVLLYRFLRHTALAEYHWWSGVLLRQFHVAVTGAASPIDLNWREPELVGVVPGTEARQTTWQRFQNQVNLPNVGVIDLGAFFDGDFDSDLRALTGAGDFRDALDVLAPLPTAELERLFTESLDAVSHRVDAWVTSLANERVVQMRQALDSAPGVYVGAYGWIENLRPEIATKITLPDGRTMRTTPGGYVIAPSMAHAMTAAVMRNAHLTHLGQAESPYTVDLSSAQVRMARFVLDSVRNGQPLGAVLGYLIERVLHESHAESLIDPIRGVAPLVANKIEDAGEPAETVAARNVVDGLTLRDKWKARQLFDVPGGLPGTIPHRDVLERQLGLLDRNVDGVADLLLAESVHQIVRGSTMASGAGLDAMAQGTRPPEPEVGRAPAGGTTLTHRLAVILAPTVPPLGAGWPEAASARASCEPRLDQWLGSLLGDPRQVRCRVQYPTRTGSARTVTVTFDELNLRPLDVLALAKSVETNPAASEIDRRVLFAAFGDSVPADAADGASFTIIYAPDPAWDRATTRSVPELLDVANAAASVIGAMRPLDPVDVVLPENASAANDARRDIPEAGDRVQAAAVALTHARDDLRNAVNAASTPPTPAEAATIRARMRATAAFGIAASFPASVGRSEGGVDALPLVAQARSVLAEIESRLQDLTNSPDDPATRATKIFGRAFQLLVGFRFPAESRAAAELRQAIAFGPTMVGSDTHAVERWLTQASRVRDVLGRWRMLRLLTEAKGGAPVSWNVAQLPHQPGASWVAMPANPGEIRPSGKLSLALHAPAGLPDPTLNWHGLFLDEWVETIPNAREHAGITFRHEDTAGEAAQAILVAVPPRLAQTWDLESLLAIINETLDLAKVRALDLESLDGLAQLIPMIYLAANAGDDTISTVLTTKLDTQILAERTG